jgi:hypothetical protein
MRTSARGAVACTSIRGVRQQHMLPVSHALANNPPCMQWRFREAEPSRIPSAKVEVRRGINVSATPGDQTQRGKCFGVTVSGCQVPDCIVMDVVWGDAMVTCAQQSLAALKRFRIQV